MRPHSLRELAWSTESLDSALFALAREAGLPHASTPPPGLSSDIADEDALRWLTGMAERIGLELEAVETTGRDLSATVRTMAPAIVRLGPSRYLLIVENGLARATVLSSTRERVRVRYADLAQAIAASIPESGDTLDRVLNYAKGTPRARARMRAAMEAELLKAKPIGGIGLLRLAPSARFRDHLRVAGLWRVLSLLVGAHASSYALFLASWWMASRGALLGYRDGAWLTGWVLALLGLIPLQVLVTWTEGRLVLGAGALLKQRLLGGALRLDIDALRAQGAGELLGRTIEANAIETLALGGGIAALVSLIEIVFAVSLLAYGVGIGAMALFLVVFCVVVLIGRRAYRARRDWFDARLAMTHDLVERMVGHRTRLVQEPPSQWHVDEDRALERYIATSRIADRSAALLTVLPRGWLLLGMTTLTLSFAQSGSTQAIVLGLAGILLGHQAFVRLCASSQNLVNALVAWRSIEPIFSSASKEPVQGSMALPPLRKAVTAGDQPVLEMLDVTYRYAGRGRPALRTCSLTLNARDRVLVEGPSGGGKSTLGLLLAGLRRPDSGVVLVAGLDEATLGLEGWRERVASAPQFHENHVFSATLAFNLLMGRRWPPSAADFAEANRVCRALALGDLLDRMPSGMQQIVGESGWQLSHGERSRLFLARALLQGPDVMVLDESFGALDPETLSTALNCVLNATPAVVVIAHP